MRWPKKAFGGGLPALALLLCGCSAASAEPSRRAVQGAKVPAAPAEGLRPSPRQDVPAGRSEPLHLPRPGVALTLPAGGGWGPVAARGSWDRLSHEDGVTLEVRHWPERRSVPLEDCAEAARLSSPELARPGELLEERPASSGTYSGVLRVSVLEDGALRVTLLLSAPSRCLAAVGVVTPELAAGDWLPELALALDSGVEVLGVESRLSPSGSGSSSPAAL